MPASVQTAHTSITSRTPLQFLTSHRCMCLSNFISMEPSLVVISVNWPPSDVTYRRLGWDWAVSITWVDSRLHLSLCVYSATTLSQLRHSNQYIINNNNNNNNIIIIVAIYPLSPSLHWTGTRNWQVCWKNGTTQVFFDIIPLSLYWQDLRIYVFHISV